MASTSLTSGNSCSCQPKKTKENVKLLVGVTASVATIKLAELCSALYALPFVQEIAVVPTEKSEKFFKSEEVISAGSSHKKKEVKIWRDSDEWAMWNGRGDPVLHIDLGKWADAMIIAPLDANTMAKVSVGMCDNLLTCVLRAWELKEIKTKPVFICPAMNTKMWDHPKTQEHIETLKSYGYTYIAPMAKTLMCGDTGIGAMASVDTIVSTFQGYVEDTCICTVKACSNETGKK
ncbi:Phosphopantothenoylcysteine decarboxylase [Orchesella cincta]|uniref:Phosphopantothenoylcysteine decarboxylase n=1 Tax=Orchesella cincta TaxID=48709 RepID=A0A1D2NBK4_ORCCI|nr:Phosphopantothenoylcysteine decarboxylase [Orchesella cincta]